MNYCYRNYISSLQLWPLWWLQKASHWIVWAVYYRLRQFAYIIWIISDQNYQGFLRRSTAPCCSLEYLVLFLLIRTLKSITQPIVKICGLHYTFYFNLKTNIKNSVYNDLNHHEQVPLTKFLRALSPMSMDVTCIHPTAIDFVPVPDPFSPPKQCPHPYRF